MKYKFKTASITQPQLSYLKQLLAAEHECLPMLPILNCALDQLQLELSIFNQNKGDPLGYRFQNKKAVDLVFHLLTERLNHLDQVRIKDQNNFVHDLKQVFQYFQNTSKQDTQLLLFLLSQLKDIRVVYEFLEESIIHKHIFFVDHEEKSLVKEFLANNLIAFIALQSQPKQNPIEPQRLCSNLKPDEIKLYQLKTLKIFSWLAQQNQLQFIAKDSESKDEFIFSNQQLFYEIVQTKTDKSREIIKKILQFQFQKIEQSYQLKQMPVKKSLIDDKLLVKIFETSGQKQNFLKIQEQKENQILLRYNLLEFTSQALANILPHALILKADSQVYSQISACFIQLFSQIKKIIQKICAGCKVSILSLQQGNIVIKQLEKHQKQRLISVCLSVWANILKVASTKTINNQKMSFNTYRQFYNNHVYSVNNIYKTLKLALQYGETQSYQLLQKATFIEKIMSSKYNRYKQAPKIEYEKLCNYRLEKIHQNCEQKRIGYNTLFQILALQENNVMTSSLFDVSSESHENSPFNNKQFMELLYQKDINSNTGFSYFAQIGPFFYKVGPYQHTIQDSLYFNGINVKYYPNLLQFCKQKLRQFLSRNHTCKASSDRKMFSELKLLLHPEILLSFSDQQLRPFSDRLRFLFNENPKLFSVYQKRLQLKQLNKLIGIDFHKQILQISQHLKMLETQSLFTSVINQTDLWFIQTSPLLQGLTKKVQLLMYYLKLIKQDKGQKQQPTFQILQLILKLQKFKKCFSSNVISLYQHLSLEEFDKFQNNHQLVFKSIKCQQFNELQGVLGQFQSHITQTLETAKVQTIIEYLKKSKIFLDINLVFREQKWQYPQELSFFSNLLYKLNKKVGHLGQIFYLQHTAQIEQMIEVIYPKCMEPNKQKWIRDYQCAQYSLGNPSFIQLILQSKKNPNGQNFIQQFLKYKVKTQLQNLFEQIFKVEYYCPKVFFNQIEYQKSAIFTLLQKSYLFYILNKIQQAPQPKELLLSYSYVINVMGSSMENLRKINIKINICRELPFKAVDQPIPLLSESPSKQAVENAVRKTIFRLFELQNTNNSAILVELSTNLYLHILECKNQDNFVGQVFKRIIKEIECQLKNPTTQSLLASFKWLNIFLQPKCQVKIEEYLSVELIDGLCSFFKTITPNQQHTKQDLSVYLFFLQQLLPSSFPAKNAQQIFDFTINVLEIMGAFIDLTSRDNGSLCLCQSAIAKIIKSKNKNIYPYISRFIHPSLYLKVGDVICQLMAQQAHQANLWSEIVAFFYKNDFNEESQLIEVSLNTFVYQFKEKSPKWSQIAEIMNKLSIKVIYREQSILLVLQKEKVNFQEHENFSASLCYQPFQAIRDLVRFNMEQLLGAQNQNHQSNILNNIKKVIHHYPILLSFIAFYPLGQLYKDFTFLDYLMELNLKQLKPYVFQFISALLFERNAIIRSNGKVFMVGEIIAYHLVRNLMKSELTIKDQCLILPFFQLKYFSKMCLISIQNLSFRDIIEKQLIKCQNKIQCTDRKLIYLSILSLLYRQQPIEKIQSLTDWDIKHASNFNLVNRSLIPFDCLFSKSPQKDQPRIFSASEKHKNNDRDLKHACQSIFLQLGTARQLQQKIKRELLLKCSPQILKLFGTSNFKISIALNHPTISVILNNNFRAYRNCIKDLYKESQRKNFSLRGISVFLMRKDHQHYCNIQKEYQAQQQNQLRVEASNYAALDYNTNYVPTENHSQQQDHVEEQSYQQIQSILLSSLSKIMDRRQSNQNARQAKEFQQLFKSEQVSSMINKINDNYRKMSMKRQIDLKEVVFKSQNQILQWLRTKQLESQFDLNEQTMDAEQFQCYCLSNAVKLQRLPSNRRNKVRQLEDLCMQSYVGRTPSSDSIDYIIDTIDQNYQLLSANQAKSQELQKSKLKAPQRKPKIFQITQLPQQTFQNISDEVLFQLISLFYVKINGLMIQNFVPFLQNRKVRTKLINTLILILRQPFGQKSIFPKKIIDFSQLKQIDTQEKLVKNNIIDFLCSLYFYGLFQQQNYLLESIDMNGIFNLTMLTCEDQQTSKSRKQNQSSRYQPLKYILKHAMDSQDVCNKYKLRLLRSAKDVDASFYPSIIAFLKHFKIATINKRQYLSQLRQFQLFLNLKQLMEQQGFKKLVEEQLTVAILKEKPFLLELFSAFSLGSKEQLKNIHYQILQLQDQSFPYMYFLSQITNIYTDQQLAEGNWIIQSQQMYSKLFQVFSDINKTQCRKSYAKLFKLNKHVSMLPMKLKAQILQVQIKEIVQSKNLQHSVAEIVARRKKGIFQSAFEELRYKQTNFWLTDLDVRFVSSEGSIESGYGNGVNKQWYTLLTRGMLNLNYGLFTKTSSNYYFFNRQSWINPRHLQYFEFIGKLFALSVIHKSFNVAASFSTVIYKMLLGLKLDIQDIREQFDEGEVIKNLEKIRSFTDNSMFWQNFVYEDKKLISTKKIEFPEHSGSQQSSSNVYLLKQTIEINKSQSQDLKMPRTLKVYKVGEAIQLVPGGADIPVTLQNVQDYIERTKAKIYQLIIQGVQKQAHAFLEGFNKVLDSKYLSKFTPQELRQLVEGSDNVSIAQLKQFVTITAFKPTDDQIVWLWQALEELSGEDRAYFMQHWTGSSRIPAEGVASMELQIVKSRGEGEKRIFAQTCFNRINIPMFNTKQQLNQAVLTAINSIKLGLSILEDN